MYNKKIMEIFAEPEYMGEIRSANAIGEAGGAVVGDILKIYMVVEDEKIVEAKCKAFGSAVAIAVGSVTAKLLNNKTLNYAETFNTDKIVEVLGEIPEEKKHCLDFAKEAIDSAIEYYRKKQEKAQKLEVE